MKRGILLLIAFALLPSVSPGADRTRWYRDAKFGMFIHWGPYSLASVEASWPIMRPSPTWNITEPEYRALPRRFNPVEFDPVAWVRLAKAAGQRYIVFTSKHHDGFAMFDSNYTNYKITNTPYKQDIVAKLAAACKQENIPLGFYYSPPDMDHPGFRDTSRPSSEGWEGQPTRPEWPLYLDYMELQLTELLTRYGDVAILWFDGLGNQAKYNGRRFHDLIHHLQPATLINNRIGIAGDYDTPEQFIPKSIPTRQSPRLVGTTPDSPSADSNRVPALADFRLWETCMTINGTWAYNQNDKRYKSTRELIRMLVEVASKGGNFLLNVGPTPQGTIQPEFEERLRGIGEWMKVNGEAIYGTAYGPVQGLPHLRTTQKGTTIYAHVFDWPQGELEIKGFKGRVASATLLAGGQSITFSQAGDVLKLRVPAQAPDANVSVIALKTR